PSDHAHLLSFPTRRSSDLVQALSGLGTLVSRVATTPSQIELTEARAEETRAGAELTRVETRRKEIETQLLEEFGRAERAAALEGDRKSTRLNSSHVKISYA